MTEQYDPNQPMSPYNFKSCLIKATPEQERETQRMLEEAANSMSGVIDRLRRERTAGLDWSKLQNIQFAA